MEQDIEKKQDVASIPVKISSSVPGVDKIGAIRTVDCPKPKLMRSNQPENNFPLEINKSNYVKAKAEVDLFLSMFESCSSNDVSLRALETGLQQKLELLERKNKEAGLHVTDLETAVNCLQTNIDSIQNDLNLVDKLSHENQELKQNLKEERLKYTSLEENHERKCKNFEKQVEDIQEECEKKLLRAKQEAEEKLKEKDNEMTEKLQAKDTEIEKIKKEKHSEISLLTMEFEGKISKLQQQKVAVTMNQQQQSSNNQEIFRKKLHHLKQEYEEKISSLKAQVDGLHSQLRRESLKDVQMPTHNKMSVSNSLPLGSKRMRRF